MISEKHFRELVPEVLIELGGNKKYLEKPEYYVQYNDFWQGHRGERIIQDTIRGVQINQRYKPKAIPWLRWAVQKSEGHLVGHVYYKPKDLDDLYKQAFFKIPSNKTAFISLHFHNKNIFTVMKTDLETIDEVLVDTNLNGLEMRHSFRQKLESIAGLEAEKGIINILKLYGKATFDKVYKTD